MESDDEDDVVWVPIKDDGEHDIDWWVAEMLKKGDKFYCITCERNGKLQYCFRPRYKTTKGNEDESSGVEKKEVAGIEKPKDIYQKNDDCERKENPVTKEPKTTVSLTKSIGNKWRRFKKKVLFSPHQMAEKVEREPLDPATILENTEFRQLLESTVQMAVDKSIKEVTDKFSSIMKKLEEDLEKQQELVKKLEQDLKCKPNILKEPPMESEELEEKARESEEAELKKRRRTLVMLNVPEILSDSDHDKNLADIESVGSIFKELNIDTIPVSVYRMKVEKKDGKPKPMKVVMPTGRDQREVLKQALRSRKYNGYGTIKITTSLSTE